MINPTLLKPRNLAVVALMALVGGLIAKHGYKKLMNQGEQ